VPNLYNDGWGRGGCPHRNEEEWGRGGCPHRMKRDVVGVGVHTIGYMLSAVSHSLFLHPGI